MTRHDDSTKKYIFFSYSPKNEKQAREIIDSLKKDGYLVWFDGRRQDEETTKERLEHCESFICLMTPEYCESNKCVEELNLAKRNDAKHILSIHMSEDGKARPYASGMKPLVDHEHTLFVKNDLDIRNLMTEIHEIPQLEECRNREWKASYSPSEDISSIKVGAEDKQKRNKYLRILIYACFVVFVIAFVGLLIRTLFFLEDQEYIVFGHYEQDNDMNNGSEPIEWQLLAQEEDRKLLISRYALDCVMYNESYKDATWETCTMREWLNGYFYDEAFSDEEKSMIVRVKVTADANPDYATEMGNNTRDRVFILSVLEAQDYLPKDSGRICQPTAYADFEGVKYSGRNNTCWWWLRSCGGSSRRAAEICFDGTMDTLGKYINNDHIGVRPAIWITMDGE